MSELPSGSITNRTKEPEETKPAVRKLNKIEGTARENKSFKRKLRDTFIAEDVTNVKDYIIWDVLMPSIRDAIADSACNFIDMFFGGGGKKRRTKKKDGERWSYSTSLDDGYRSTRKDRDEGRRRDRRDPSDFIIDRRTDADDILEDMRNYIDEYGFVRVADFYDAIGVSSDYTDKSYGWKSLHNAEVRRASGGGYYIDFPRATSER